jgi:hypothetical protein
MHWSVARLDRSIITKPRAGSMRCLVRRPGRWDLSFRIRQPRAASRPLPHGYTMGVRAGFGTNLANTPPPAPCILPHTFPHLTLFNPHSLLSVASLNRDRGAVHHVYAKRQLSGSRRPSVRKLTALASW